MKTSNLWIIGIIVSAIFVTLSNIMFQISKEKERDEEIAKAEKSRLEINAISSLELIKREFLHNRTKLNDFEKAVTKNESLTHGFDTSGWDIVSSSNLILGLDKRYLNVIIAYYSLIKLANKYQEEVLDFTIGVSSLNTSAESSRKVLNKNLGETLKKISAMDKAMENLIVKITGNLDVDESVFNDLKI